MKKYIFLKVVMISLLLLSIFLLNGCSSQPTRYILDLTIAENPPGLLIDPENYAYIGGRIRAINNHDFNPLTGAMREYPTRTLRVPSGESLIALVHYQHQSSTTVFFGFKFVSLPPLENGGSYILYLSNPPFGPSSFQDRHIKFLKLNQDSGIYENVLGVTFAD